MKNSTKAAVIAFFGISIGFAILAFFIKWLDYTAMIAGAAFMVALMALFKEEDL